MARLRFFNLSLVSVIAASSLVACNDDSDETNDSTLDAADIADLEAKADELVAAGVPGVSLAIIAGDQTVLIARGVADRTTNSAMTTSHHFRAASIAKSVTASVVLQLVEEGELQLTDTVEDWLPGMLPANAHATIEDLLRLESGIFDFGRDERLNAPYYAGDFGFTWQPEQLVALATDHPPVFAPGEQFDYSNTNYVLLALIIQKITGDTLANVVRARIFDPLGMSESAMPTDSVIEPPYASGYMLGIADEPMDVTAISQSSVFGNGNLVSTPLESARFYGALVRGEIVSDTQLADMLRPNPEVPDTRYGMGVWRLTNVYPCGTFYGHDGATPGYDVSAYSNREASRQFAVMVNSLTPAETVGSEQAQQAWKELGFAAACN